MTPRRIHFSVEHTSPTGSARAGVLQTTHSTVLTPVFMPVGTHAVVRGHGTDTLTGIGFKILLANTYHLLLRPGPDVFRTFGDIHRFMNWPESILTDSGGFQVFSLAPSRTILDDGVGFRSYVDGRHILLTPELSIDTQKAIGSDIMMVLDHCVSSVAERSEVKAAMDLTHVWAERSIIARGESSQALFGIVQGGCLLDLRRESAEQITSLSFDGYAIGGVAVGEAIDIRNDVIAYTADLLPKESPRYLMGVGTPIDLLESVARGMDMFDCIVPTALAQQGVCFTSQGKLDLRRGMYRLSKEPIDPHCTCSTCLNFSRGYLHHLVKVGEFQGGTLIGIHNLHFYFQLMAEMREAILSDSFERYYQDRKPHLMSSDASHRISIPKKRPKKDLIIGDYELQRNGTFTSVRQRSSGEVMHSVSNPDEEAEKLYVSQSRLYERITSDPDHPLVIWDVGLGAATNAMAVVKAFERAAVQNDRLASVDLVSFEKDLDSLKLALRFPQFFPHIRHSAPQAILESSIWRSKVFAFTWSLIEGDFLHRLQEAPAPDLIFFDPFSYKTDTDLWTLGAFSKLFLHCKTSGTELYTYSSSTSVRTALLLAGFFVARGVGTGPKGDTTIAFSSLERAKLHGSKLLGREWLERWERSESKLPPGSDSIELSAIVNQVRTHPQFFPEGAVSQRPSSPS
jgi:queuine tRNA-ribosyltransferase